jgi:hypothetical protein
MNDQNQQFETGNPPEAPAEWDAFQPPPPPGAIPPPVEAPRPTKLRPFAIASAILGLLCLGLGIAKVLPGGIGTGLAFICWGIILFAFSFIRLPQVTGDEAPMSGAQKLMGIFFEPTRVFRNLRAHPYWLAAFLVVGILNAAYATAFVQRLTPERIVDYTFEKLGDTPFKPPAEAMEKAKDDALQQAKQPIQRVQTVAKSFVGLFVLASLSAAFCFLAILAFGGRMNFWQAFAAVLYSWVPYTVISKLLSLVLLYVKTPDDIHPLMGQETLVQDNLGYFIVPADHPALYVLGTAIGFVSLYHLWLKAKGLANAGTKVSSGVAWGVSITLWILFLILGMILATLFSSFLS